MLDGSQKQFGFSPICKDRVTDLLISIVDVVVIVNEDHTDWSSDSIILVKKPEWLECAASYDLNILELTIEVVEAAWNVQYQECFIEPCQEDLGKFIN